MIAFPKASSALGVALVAALAVAGCSTTKRSPPSKQEDAPGLAGSAFIPEDRRTLEPFSHVLFCRKYSGECGSNGGPDQIALTASRKAELATVNRDINDEILSQNESGGDDVWRLSPSAGDCEDYAVTKRHRLIDQGWPASTLRLAIGYTRKGEGHLVLVVRTTEGDIVLNNETSAIRKWQDAGLSWREVQSARNPHIWYTIRRDGDAAA